MLRRLNKVLPELVLGIFVYGLVLQFASVWFASDKLKYSIGLWIGILLAAGMAVHIASVIEDAVSIGGGSRLLAVKSLLRYVIVTVVFFVMMYFDFGNLIGAFLGIMGLKVAAYLQPFIHKFILKMQGREEETQVSEEH